MPDVLKIEPPQTPRALMIEVPAGELLDKMTILQIKSERIRDPQKSANIHSELQHLNRVYRESVIESAELSELIAELKQINQTLWEIEDQIRICERRSDFGDHFITLARAVYKTNDRRAAVKRRINDLLGSHFKEEKSYESVVPDQPQDKFQDDSATPQPLE